MIQDLKRTLPLLLLIAASMFFVPVNPGLVTLVVAFMWTLGLAIAVLDGRKPGYFGSIAILGGFMLAGLNIAAFVHMTTWRLAFWESFFPTSMAATIAIIASMAVNQKTE